MATKSPLLDAEAVAEVCRAHNRAVERLASAKEAERAAFNERVAAENTLANVILELRKATRADERT
jgi:hypothetical protein